MRRTSHLISRIALAAAIALVLVPPSVGSAQTIQPLQQTPQVTKGQTTVNGQSLTDTPARFTAPAEAHASGVQGSATTTPINEGFEGTFPGNTWTLTSTLNGVSGGPNWAPVSCVAFAGSFSGWPAGSTCNSNYPNNLNSWMVSKPFSLVGATAAQLTYQRWLETELGYDFLCVGASTDGNTFYGFCGSGNSGGQWQQQTLDLASLPQLGSVLGQSNVYIGFQFLSDQNINFRGPYVDEIKLTVTTPGGNGPSNQRLTRTATGTTLTWDLPAGVTPSVLRWVDNVVTAVPQAVGTTSYTDNAAVTTFACYQVFAIVGSSVPKTPLECRFPAQFGNTAPNFSIGPATTGNNIDVRWNIPAGTVTNFILVSSPIGGTATTTVLANNVTSQTVAHNNVNTCVILATVNGVTITGLTDWECFYPGTGA